MRIPRSVVLALVLPELGAAIASAQEIPRPTGPQIVTSAQGEVRVTPDRATVTIGVQSRSTTAAEAANQNSRKQRAVIDAIKARGVPAEQIGTSSFNVVPETRYDAAGQAAPRTTSYLVMNTVIVELRKIDQVGPVIDAALSAGANQINSLSFGVAASDSARRAALALAVERARGDAEVMARAAGGTLGPLLELTAGDTYAPPRPMMAEMAMAVGRSAVPIEPGQEVVRVNVIGRWQFSPGPR